MVPHWIDDGFWDSLIRIYTLKYWITIWMRSRRRRRRNKRSKRSKKSKRERGEDFSLHFVEIWSAFKRRQSAHAEHVPG